MYILLQVENLLQKRNVNVCRMLLNSLCDCNSFKYIGQTLSYIIINPLIYLSTWEWDLYTVSLVSSMFNKYTKSPSWKNQTFEYEFTVIHSISIKNCQGTDVYKYTKKTTFRTPAWPQKCIVLKMYDAYGFVWFPPATL